MPRRRSRFGRVGLYVVAPAAMIALGYFGLGPRYALKLPGAADKASTPHPVATDSQPSPATTESTPAAPSAPEVHVETKPVFEEPEVSVTGHRADSPKPRRKKRRTPKVEQPSTDQTDQVTAPPDSPPATEDEGSVGGIADPNGQ